MNYIHGMKLMAIFLLSAMLVAACNMRQPFPAKTGTIAMGNNKIYYEEGGQKSSEALILLHAGFLNTNMWKMQVQEFSKDYRVIAIDVPGHGRSENDTVRLYPAGFIKTVMDSLDVSKASLIGVSLGASCVTAMAKYFDYFFAALEKDTAQAAEIFTKMWFDGPYRKPKDVDSEARNYIYESTLANMKKHHVRGWPAFAEPTALEQLPSINLPVLIIHGDKDEPQITKTCTYIEQNLKGAKRVLMPGVGHMLNLEAPDKFNELVLNFLKQ